MRIESSNISMASSHQFAAVDYHETETMTMQSSEAATLSFSAEAIAFTKQIRDHKEGKTNLFRDGQQQEEEKQDDYQEYLKRILQDQKKAIGSGRVSISGKDGMKLKTDEEMKMEIMRRIMAALKGQKPKATEESVSLDDYFKKKGQEVKTGSTALWSAGSSTSVRSSKDVAILLRRTWGTSTPLANTTKWTKVTATSGIHGETENTAFTTEGTVRTSDGRSLSFNVELQMSRSFTQQYNKISQQDYFVTDPLVINLDTNAASVTDQKFLFDLDCDGKEDKISFAGKGSGFLALDKNGDGKINDGNELFGTKSGNGFADLAAYDEDGNGWIDENDSVFSNLKVWTKDINGNDRLLALGEAGVGAIYLGYSDTQFTLDGENYEPNAFIRSTGIYLKESGEAGTIQHVDLVV